MKALLRATPEQSGISSVDLLKLLNRLKKMNSLNGIMVMRHGKVCMEGWWKPYAPDIAHVLFSLSKSFVSVAIGIAQEEKLLTLSDRVISFFPEYKNDVTDPRMHDVTLKHLLTMASGHAECAKAQMEADPEHIWARGFLSSTLKYAPGERFAYNSAATFMLAAVIVKVTGQNVREYLLPRLFEPLGIIPGIWENNPQGINKGGWGLYLTTEDIAKFAQLLLDNGIHEGKTLIPAAYLKEATSKQIDNSMNSEADWKIGYGYQFWMCQHGFRGDGASGQYAVVIPEYDIAIAANSSIDNMQQILDAFWQELLPAVKKDALPENPAAHAELVLTLSHLQMPIAQGEISLRHPNVSFSFRHNSAGISACSVEFGEKECALVFHTTRGTEILRAGFGEFRKGIFQLTDIMPHLTAASAVWKSKDILEIHAFCYDSTFSDVYTIDFTNRTSPLTRASRFSTFRPELPRLELHPASK